MAESDGPPEAKAEKYFSLKPDISKPFGRPPVSAHGDVLSHGTDIGPLSWNPTQRDDAETRVSHV